jgi:hypothetical protein
MRMNPKRKSSSAQQISRGRPAFSDTQREEVLEMLRAAGQRGISRAVLIFDKHFTQCGTRIFELEKMGYVIRHDLEPGARFVTYFLVSEPEKEKPLPTYQPRGADPRQRTFANSSDWYVKEHGPRPGSASPASGLPLFENSGDKV